MVKWIMVVDDDMANLKMAGSILSKNHMKVTALKSGRAMLDYIEKNGAPDLILLDIKMPEMDGFEAYDQLRQLEQRMELREIPVIFLTADTNTGSETKGFEIGVSDYVRKPFNPDVLIRRIENVLSVQNEMISLKNDATIDKLTGLLNKGATSNQFSKLCMERKGCLMMIDLDSFKLVNDIYGHEMGDKVLITFAEIIRKEIPGKAWFGRIGGDEFTAFSEGITDEEGVANLSKKLNEEFLASAKQLMGEDMSIPLGVSIGAIMVPIYGNDYSSLLKLADKCLYKVKKNGKHGYSVYSSEAMVEEEAGSAVMDIKSLSEILGERNIQNVALQLDMEAFSYVYRYAIRYFIRNNINSSRILFTLNKVQGQTDVDFMNYADEFGNHIRESLRKSDILTRSRYNQYYILITDVREEFVERVMDKIVENWKIGYGDVLDISYETEFIRNDVGISGEDVQADIVMIDDDPINIDYAKSILSRHGVNVIPFNSGEDFLEYASTSETLPDLILLDVKMPLMDGFAVMDEINKIGGDLARVPVMLLTADSSEEYEAEGLERGAVDFIRKPFAPSILTARVNHILELVVLRRKYRRSL
ncbi:MAG: response regulator [Eubacterium sp.]|nr:response regulator [Eubacterium sp.]